MALKLNVVINFGLAENLFLRIMHVQEAVLRAVVLMDIIQLRTGLHTAPYLNTKTSKCYRF